MNNYLKFGIDLKKWLEICSMQREDAENQIRKNIDKTFELLANVWGQKDALSISPTIEESEKIIANYYDKQ